MPRPIAKIKGSVHNKMEVGQTLDELNDRFAMTGLRKVTGLDKGVQPYVMHPELNRETFEVLELYKFLTGQKSSLAAGTATESPLGKEVGKLADIFSKSGLEPDVIEQLRELNQVSKGFEFDQYLLNRMLADGADVEERMRIENLFPHIVEERVKPIHLAGEAAMRLAEMKIRGPKTKDDYYLLYLAENDGISPIIETLSKNIISSLEAQPDGVGKYKPGWVGQYLGGKGKVMLGKQGAPFRALTGRKEDVGAGETYRVV